MLKIRLRRMGAIRQPHYRIVVADARAPRDGAFIDMLGHYNPLTDPATIQVDVAKYEDWKKKGAQPTNAVASLMKLFNRAQRAEAASEAGTAKASTLTRTASGKRSTRATAAPVAEAEAEAAPVSEIEAEAAPVAELEAEAAPVAEEAAAVTEPAADTEEAAAPAEETTEETPA
jgi:small subunit ribosomal protein S16